MNKKKRTVVVGKVCFTSERIVVADPAYEVDSRYVVCLNIIPGEYTYYAKIKQEGKSEFVSSLSIVNAQTRLKKLHTDKLIGRIMVDVGFAGFFENKQDYSSDERWGAIGELLLAKSPAIVEAKPDNAFMCNGIITTAGDGDGIYGVYELRDEQKRLCGYKLKFL